jgi:hypothetical protein
MALFIVTAVGTSNSVNIFFIAVTINANSSVTLANYLLNFTTILQSNLNYVIHKNPCNISMIEFLKLRLLNVTQVIIKYTEPKTIPNNIFNLTLN